MSRIFCIESNKTKLCFPTEKAAFGFLKFNEGEYEKELRPYYCECCCGWHLTSHYDKGYKPQKVNNMIKAYRKDMKTNFIKKKMEKVDYEIMANSMDISKFKSKNELKKFLNEHQNKIQMFSDGEFRHAIYNRFENETHINKS